MGLNFGVAVFKIVIGTIANSGSIIADGYHSLSDGSGNIVGIVGLSIAGRPIDNSHPYGHKKFETISSMIIGMLLFVVGSKVAYSSIFNIIHPKTPEISIISFAVIISTLIVNIFVVIYERSQGQKLSSDVLVSDSEHTKSDVLITCGVIFTMILLRLGVPPIIDGCVSLLISGFIYKASFKVFVEATQTLTDSAVLRSEEIYEATMSCEEVKACHKIRTRGRRDEVYIDLHVLVIPEMKVSEAHALQHKIENTLKSKFGCQLSAIIHVETVVLLSQQKACVRIEVDLDLDELDATGAETKATYAEIKDYVLKEHGLKEKAIIDAFKYFEMVYLKYNYKQEDTDSLNFY